MAESFTWFFVLFHREFRRGNIDVFQTLMGLSLAHFFGCYNPKQLADYLGIPHQPLYEQLKTLSLYSLKKMLFRFMEIIHEEQPYTFLWNGRQVHAYSRRYQNVNWYGRGGDPGEWFVKPEARLYSN